jgi:ubiquinol-cytochrome c reductase cytochrome c subunit
VLVAAAALALTGAHGTGRAVAVTEPTPTDTATGRQVFLRDCAWCHGTDASGTHNGPDLVGVGAEDADFYLRTGRMPLGSPDQTVRPGPPKYDDATITAIADYIGSLGGPGIPALGPGDIANGRTLFLENCAACHSASGTGTILTGGQRVPDLWHTAPTQVAEAIRVGPGAMPPFSEHQVSPQELNDIVAYVHQLGSPQDPGGAGLDQYGPIAEGAVALFGLLLGLVIVIRLLGRRAPERKEGQ